MQRCRMIAGGGLTPVRVVAAAPGRHAVVGGT
nr:MAG TPA: hypothetical protein [Caudoviricetes sp.]